MAPVTNLAAPVLAAGDQHDEPVVAPVTKLAARSLAPVTNSPPRRGPGDQPRRPSRRAGDQPRRPVLAPVTNSLSPVLAPVTNTVSPVVAPVTNLAAPGPRPGDQRRRGPVGASRWPARQSLRSGELRGSAVSPTMPFTAASRSATNTVSAGLGGRGARNEELRTTVTSPALPTASSVGGQSPSTPRGPLPFPPIPTSPSSSSSPSPSSDGLTGSTSVLIFGVIPAACLLEALRRKLSRARPGGFAAERIPRAPRAPGLTPGRLGRGPGPPTALSTDTSPSPEEAADRVTRSPSR